MAGKTNNVVALRTRAALRPFTERTDGWIIVRIARLLARKEPLLWRLLIWRTFDSDVV